MHCAYRKSFKGSHKSHLLLFHFTTYCTRSTTVFVIGIMLITVMIKMKWKIYFTTIRIYHIFLGIFAQEAEILSILYTEIHFRLGWVSEKFFSFRWIYSTLYKLYWGIFFDQMLCRLNVPNLPFKTN